MSPDPPGGAADAEPALGSKTPKYEEDHVDIVVTGRHLMTVSDRFRAHIEEKLEDHPARAPDPAGRGHGQSRAQPSPDQVM